jgi:hypothetical protein
MELGMLLRWVFPLLLLGAALARTSYISLAYLVLFFVFAIVHPTSGLPSAPVWYYALCFLIAGGMCVAHIVYHSLYAAGLLGPTAQFPDFSLLPFSDELAAVQALLPDMVLAFVSLTCLLVSRHMAAQRVYKSSASGVWFNTRCMWCACCMALGCVLNPSLLCATYLAGFLAFLVTKYVAQRSVNLSGFVCIVTICAFTGYAMVHTKFLYMFQFEFLNTSVPVSWAALLGLFTKDQALTAARWELFISAGCICLLGPGLLSVVSSLARGD